jgi:6-phosphogluconolactonase
MPTHPPNDPVLYSFGSNDDLISALAGFIVKAQREAIDKKGRFTIALSGGSLPKMLKGLIDTPGIKWDKWCVYQLSSRRSVWSEQNRRHVFYADERAVPLDDPESNHHLCTTELFAHVPLPAAHINTLDPAFLDDLDELADAYEQALIREFAQRNSARFPVFDAVLLGLGPDGHTASLFPVHALLGEEDRWVAPVEDAPKSPPRRITLTLPVIKHAVRVAFVATGAGKADVLHAVIDEPECVLPAARVKPVYPGHLYWFVDDAAAAKVQYPKTPFELWKKKKKDAETAKV